MANRRQRRRAWLWVMLWAALVLVGTSVPGVAVSGVPAGSDKLAHLLMYAPLAALLVRALQAGSSRRRRPWGAALLTILLVAVFAALDEWHQQFIPRRSCDFRDWHADLLGALTGAMIAILWHHPRTGETRNG